MQELELVVGSEQKLFNLMDYFKVSMLSRKSTKHKSTNTPARILEHVCTRVCTTLSIAMKTPH